MGGAEEREGRKDKECYGGPSPAQYCHIGLTVSSSEAGDGGKGRCGPAICGHREIQSAPLLGLSQTLPKQGLCCLLFLHLLPWQ